MQIFIQVYRRKKFTAAKSLPPQKVYRHKNVRPAGICSIGFRHAAFTACNDWVMQCGFLHTTIGICSIDLLHAGYAAWIYYI
jgi:hypothetical protein